MESKYDARNFVKPHLPGNIPLEPVQVHKNVEPLHQPIEENQNLPIEVWQTKAEFFKPSCGACKTKGPTLKTEVLENFITFQHLVSFGAGKELRMKKNQVSCKKIAWRSLY